MAAAVHPPQATVSSRRFPKYPSSTLTITITSTPRRPRRFSCCLAVDRQDQGAPAPASANGTTPGSGLRVVFTGGGTGGHIYPAIAIADDLKNACPDAEVLFVGSDAGMESDAVPAAGYTYKPIPTPRPASSVFSPANLLLPFRLLCAVAAGWRILRDFRPQLVVGTGGYVAVPVCLAAALSRITLVIQEQNAVPGLATRTVAPFAQKVFLAFNGCVRHFPKEKCIVYGNPVRLSLRRYVSKAVARSHFFPKVGKQGNEKGQAQVVLVLGGSAGCDAINIAVLNMYHEMLMRNKNRYIIWQTGTERYNEMESLVKNHRRIVLTPFLQRMDLAYAAADVVVSRAGAMTCTEILTTGKPSILIPSPTSAADHQIRNAYIMVEVAGSIVLEEDELDSSSLETAIEEVLGNDSLMAEMSKKALTVARPNASADIVRCILSLIKIPSK